MEKLHQIWEQEFGNDAEFLYENGYDVTCVDKSEEAKQYINKKNKNLNVIVTSFENLKLTKKYDLIYSNFGIAFCNKNYIDTLINEIKNSINENGFFVGNFFGINDEWNDENHSKMKFFTEEEIEKNFEDFKIYYVADKKFIKDSSREKDKKWHVIEIYAQRDKNGKINNDNWPTSCWKNDSRSRIRKNNKFV